MVLGGVASGFRSKIKSKRKIHQSKYKDNLCSLECVRLNYNTDKDIIKKLDEVDSKMGYIKELIRKDLQTNKK